jgi:predicted aldo/keto reductase-like oxidoreductase
MEYTKLGRTGLDVSRICLGCMSYGGGNHAWSLGEEESRPFIKRAPEAGHQFLRYGEPLFARQQRGDSRACDQGFRPTQ